MIVPGIVSATFKGRPVEETLELAVKAGLKAIEWSENHHLPKGDLAFASKVRQMTLDSGLELAGYGSYYRLGQEMDIRPSLETCCALGSPSMRIWAGSKPSAELEATERKVLMDELSKAVEIAETYKVVLNLEWHKNTLTDENQSGLDVLEQIHSPWLRTLWQPTQALSFEQRTEGLGMVLPYLSYMHVYYWDATGRRPFSEGVEHWRKYFSMLDVEKRYYALMEFVMGDSVEQFNMDAEVLEGLLNVGE